MIKPTVGRIVWFWPAKSDPLYRESAPAAQPMAAQICYVWSDTMVNLSVTDYNGQTHPRTSVNLCQGIPTQETHNANFCEWMPYQKEKEVEKTAEKADAAHESNGKTQEVLRAYKPAERLSRLWKELQKGGVGPIRQKFIAFQVDLDLVLDGLENMLGLDPLKTDATEFTVPANEQDNALDEAVQGLLRELGLLKAGEVIKVDLNKFRDGASCPVHGSSTCPDDTAPQPPSKGDLDFIRRCLEIEAGGGNVSSREVKAFKKAVARVMDYANYLKGVVA